MIAVAVVLLLLALVGGVVASRSRSTARRSAEVAIGMHSVRRQMDVSILKGQIKADALRLRREIDEELRRMP